MFLIGKESKVLKLMYFMDNKHHIFVIKFDSVYRWTIDLQTAIARLFQNFSLSPCHWIHKVWWLWYYECSVVWWLWCLEVLSFSLSKSFHCGFSKIYYNQVVSKFIKTYIFSFNWNPSSSFMYTISPNCNPWAKTCQNRLEKYVLPISCNIL